MAGPCRILTGFRDASPANSVVENQPIEDREVVSNERSKEAQSREFLTLIDPSLDPGIIRVSLMRDRELPLPFDQKRSK